MKRFFSILRLVPIVAATLVAGVAAEGPAHAETSEWAVSEGGRMRLVLLPPDAGGSIRAGLQIEPEPGWITYWREPGDSGIPPQIAIGGGVALTAVGYPVPRHIEAGGLRDFGYDTAVTLPLSLRVTDTGAAGFDTQVFIGLCKNICIPFQANFTVALPKAAQSAPVEAAILDAAAATLPEPPGRDFKVVAFALSADRTRLRLDLTLPADDSVSPEIIVTGPSGYVFTAQEKGVHTGASFSTELAIGKLPKNYQPGGKQWGLLVKAGGRAMETTLAFE